VFWTWDGLSVPLTFSGGGVERMRLTPSGSLLVGSTVDVGYTIQAGHPTDPNSNPGGTMYAGVPGNTGTYTFTSQTWYFNHMRFLWRGTAAGDISSPNAASVSYNTSSDYRMKQDVQNMTGALSRVMALRPVTWMWKEEFGAKEGEGFIAHELQAVCPAAVSGEKDAVDDEGKPKYQGVDTSFLVATLTAAIQELKAEFDAYKASHP
jgi:hypothetical protein